MNGLWVLWVSRDNGSPWEQSTFKDHSAPEDVDHDQLADAMADYLAAKQHAHHPDSPDGREIAECEDAELCTRLAVVKAAA